MKLLNFASGRKGGARLIFRDSGRTLNLFNDIKVGSYVVNDSNFAVTKEHGPRKIGDPVRSRIIKLQIDRLVIKWVINKY